MTDRPILNPALQRAVDLAGGQTSLARRINQLLGQQQKIQRKQCDIWSWLFRTGEVPTAYLIPIEQAVDGQVSVRELITGRLDPANRSTPQSRPEATSEQGV